MFIAIFTIFTQISKVLVYNQTSVCHVNVSFQTSECFQMKLLFFKKSLSRTVVFTTFLNKTIEQLLHSLFISKGLQNHFNPIGDLATFSKQKLLAIVGQHKQIPLKQVLFDLKVFFF